ncbi:MAG TPA: fused MFS/spermidine synthase [Syntrophales bacterium]|nr:fused MFS/spermidine synthase [Syntrophales bacterium]
MVALLYYLLGPTHWYVAVILLTLFSLICLISHGTLYEIRPSSEHLTRFYLAVAFGGWLGGAAVSLVAPLAFRGLYEYPALLLLFVAVFFWCRHSHVKEILPDFTTLGALRVVLIVLVITQLGRAIYHRQDVMFQHRNFYGTYRVIEGPSAVDATRKIRKLVHGAQWLDGTDRAEPISYYYRGGAISQVFTAVQPPRNIAVVGLGTGAAAAYAGAQDRMTFYEIDPDIEQVAHHWFTYLGDSMVMQRIVVGDGRLVMQSEQSNHPKYDIVLVDAFTGDGIPVHLLTCEALAVYMASLEKDGLLLLHVSNRYYVLQPLIKAVAQELNLYGAINISVAKSRVRQDQIDKNCVVLSRSRSSLQPLLEAGWVLLGEDDLDRMEPWTDDYINILEPMWKGMKTKYSEWKMDTFFRWIHDLGIDGPAYSPGPISYPDKH